MRAFDLELGESHFRLLLAPECADLLGAFYPRAVPTQASAGRGERHRIQIEAQEDEFRVAWLDPDSGQRRQSRFPRPELALLALEEAVERRVIAEAAELLALHGGAVAAPESTCLILGDSESGKSSTTFQLVELGATFLCEEVSLCEPDTLAIVPYLQTLSISDSLLAEFAAEFEIRGHASRVIAPIVRYRPPELPEAGRSQAPVDRILLPRFRVDAAASLSPVTPEDALTEILGYSFEPNVEAEIQFDRLIALVERVEILRFVYPNAKAARAALSDLFGF